MTLNITLLTPTAIYQSADFRLTDPSDGSPIRDESAKTVVLRYMSWSGFVTYTRLGSWEDENLSHLAADWLTGTYGATMTNVAAILERDGTRLLREVRLRNGTLFPHTFVLAGFEDHAARAFVISNFKDSFGRTRLANRRPSDVDNARAAGWEHRYSHCDGAAKGHFECRQANPVQASVEKPSGWRADPTQDAEVERQCINLAGKRRFGQPRLRGHIVSLRWLWQIADERDTRCRAETNSDHL